MTAAPIEAPVELITEDCWLYAHIIDNTLHVYRSIRTSDEDPWYRPVIDLVGDAEPLTRETVTDPMMMGGKAEVLTYAVGAGQVAA